MSVLWLPSCTFDVLKLCIVVCRCGLNNILSCRLSALLFVGVVPMINLDIFCSMHLCKLGCCCFVSVSVDIRVLWLPIVDINLCVVVCGCSPIINFVIAFCCVVVFGVSVIRCVLWLQRVTC